MLHFNARKNNGGRQAIASGAKGSRQQTGRGQAGEQAGTLVPEKVSVAGGSFILFRYEAPSNCELEMVTYNI